MSETRKKLIKLLCQKGFGVEGATIAADHLIANGVTVMGEKDRLADKDWPPYMDNPRKSSANVCAGCVHEATNKGSFPCDECKRKLRGEHDMFVKKVEE